MDTSAVPEFKIAKVGKERKRRGAGASLFGGGSGGGGAFSGATGANAVAGLSLAAKMGVLALIGTLSAGAWQVGKSLRPDETAASGQKPKIFASSENNYSDADLANVIRSNDSSIPNSMGYVKGSLDGMSAEERAKKEAEAAEAARLAEEEAKKSEAANAPADVAGAPAAVDPNAMMQGMGEKKDEKAGAFGKKFGSLSSSFGGGGLAGGAGLAGGVNRGFSNANLKSKNNAGKMAAMRGGSNPSISKGSGARAGASNNKGFARRQLSNAFSLSRQAATAGKGESSAQAASSAFDNTTPGGNVISGPGVGAGTGGAGVDAGGSVNPNTGGAINPNDDAAPISNNKGKNVTKYQGLVDLAKILLMIAAALAVILILFRDSLYGTAVAAAIALAIMAIGAMVLILGVAIMAQGEPLLGGIFAAVGGYTVATSFIPDYYGGAGAAVGDLIANFAAHALVTSAVGLLGSQMAANKGNSGSMN